MFDSKLYKETFSQVRASEETLSEVLNMSKKYRNGHVSRGARLLIAAAIATCLLATTAFAYVGFTRYENPMELLGTFFGSEEARTDPGQIVHETYYDLEYDLVQPTVEHVPLDEALAEEQVAPYISDVGNSVTYRDYTLTVEAHLYDSATDCGIIYYTLENPNGVSGYQLQYDGEVWWPGGELIVVNNAHGKNYIISDETTDTKLSVAHYYSSVYGEENCIRIGFRSHENDLILPLEDGGGLRALVLADGDIQLSAIGIRINAESMEFLQEYDSDGTLLPPMVDNIESLIIRYQDGSEYLVYRDMEGQSVQNYAYCIQDMYGEACSYTLNRLVDVDQVEAVIINDMEYLVNE